MFYKRPFPTLWILIFLGCLLICMQYITIDKLSALSPALSYVTLTKYIQTINEKVSFGWIDISLSVLFLATSALVLWQEKSKRALTDFLQNVFSSERKTLYLLLACSLVCVRFYFARGGMHWAADTSHHIAQSYLVARAIADGELPIWTFLMGNGSPYMQNYGFAFFYLVGLVDFFCRNIFLSLKLVMGTAHVLSGIGMYYLASSLCQSRRAGFIAGLGYVLCFWHTQHVLIMGRLPLSLFYALLPWPFYAVENLIRSSYKVRAAFIGGLSIALLNFTHPGYGTYAMVFWGCYCVVRLWSLWSYPDLKSIFRAGVLLLILGVTFSAYMNVGMWFEREHTNMHSFRAGLKAPAEQVGLSTLSDPTWRHLLGWSNHRFWLIPPEPFHWYGGYLGISLCVLALASVGIALFRRNGLRHFASGWACLVLSVMVIFAYRLPPFNMLSLVHASNASRYLLFLAFFLALAAGIGTLMLLQHRPGWLSRNRCFTLLFLFLWIDLFPTTFLHAYQPPVDRSSSGFQNIWKVSAPFSERGELPNYRVHWLDKDEHLAFRMAFPLFMHETPISEAFHPGELRTRSTFTDPFLQVARYLAPDLLVAPDQLNANDLVSELLRSGFYLLNTRYVLLSEKKKARQISLNYNSPIIVSTRLVSYDPETAYQIELTGAKLDSLSVRAISQVLWIIGEMGIRPQNNSCEHIFVRDREGSDLGTEPTAQVLAHVVRHQQVQMKVAISEACYARLSYAYFPYLHITVDGTPVEPLETAGRFIALPLDAGEHDIVIQARLSPLRRGLIGFSSVMLLVALALVFIEQKRKSSGSRLNTTPR
ncbi:MAG: hypothetical protein F4Y79_20460 [Gemmatimonadetes bacterium]|nr:hypothetical protein [Gemmatimonadota bacterium]